MSLYTQPDFLYEEPLDILEKEPVKGSSEMSAWQQSFLCGLLRKEMPKKILEVGVSAGGTTAVILNCMKKLGLSNSHLYSVDLADRYYQDTSLPTGYVVGQAVPDMVPSWTLQTGHGIAHWLEGLGGQIDFVVLDAAHTLPGELLDFIAILPFLSPGATVVLHDMHLHRFADNSNHCVATHTLFHTVFADKIICPLEPDINDLPNIAAFRVTPDTIKYKEQLFYALSMPWAYLPKKEDIEDFRNLIAKYYSADGVSYFDNCVCYERNNCIKIKDICHVFSEERKKIVVWGAGSYGQQWIEVMLHQVDQGLYPRPDVVIVDSDSLKHGTHVNGFPVLAPESVLRGPADPGYIVVCVMSKNARRQIMDKLEEWGYHEGKDVYFMGGDLE